MINLVNDFLLVPNNTLEQYFHHEQKVFKLDDVTRILSAKGTVVSTDPKGLLTLSFPDTTKMQIKLVRERAEKIIVDYPSGAKLSALCKYQKNYFIGLCQKGEFFFPDQSSLSFEFSNFQLISLKFFDSSKKLVDSFSNKVLTIRSKSNPLLVKKIFPTHVLDGTLDLDRNLLKGEIYSLFGPFVGEFDSKRPDWNFPDFY